MKNFATKGVRKEINYFFNGVEINEELVWQIMNDPPYSQRTEEKIIAAGIEVRKTESVKLIATHSVDHSGPSLPEYVETTTDGWVHFRKQYGDRAAGYELKARVMEQNGCVTILGEFERREFHYEIVKGKWVVEHPIFTDWRDFNLDGVPFSNLDW